MTSLHIVRAACLVLAFLSISAGCRKAALSTQSVSEPSEWSANGIRGTMGTPVRLANPIVIEQKVIVREKDTVFEIPIVLRNESTESFFLEDVKKGCGCTQILFQRSEVPPDTALEVLARVTMSSFGKEL